MFRIYSATKVMQLLAEQGSPLTLRLGRYDAAWMPHPVADRYAPGVSGPADRVTYTLLDGNQIKADVNRGKHRWVFEPPTRHALGPAPGVAADRAHRKLHRLVWAAMSIYLAFVLAGVEIGYAAFTSRRDIGALIGGVAGYLSAYVANLVVMIALHIRQRGH